ncbi:MAG: SDR family NAD(P)-dependent oxidoreductase [Myxococcota bacterium]
MKGNRAAARGATPTAPREPLRYDGRVVLVTGAGRGIGHAVAELLAARGARLVVHNRRAVEYEVDPAGERAAAIRARGGEAIAVHGDVADPGTARRLVEAALAQWGRLDAVVMNAGRIASRAVAELEESELERLYVVNALSAFRLTRAALPALRRAGAGRLVYTTSTAGLFGGAGLAAYGMAKAALLALMRAVAEEEHGHGVLANAICPTAATRMTEAFVEDAAMREALSPAAVAPAVAWLASDACTVRGRVVLASGGLFRSAHVLQSDGVDLRAEAPIGPEHLVASSEAILAASGLHDPADAGAHFGAVIDALRASPPRDVD